MKNLNKYITYRMALELMGANPDQNTRIYRILEDNDDIEVLKIGHMRLLNREQFCDAAGVSASTEKVRWPVHLAVIGIDEIVSVEDAAKMMSLSARQIYNLADNDAIHMYDLSLWGGQKVFIKHTIERELKYREVLDDARILKRTPKAEHGKETIKQQ